MKGRKPALPPNVIPMKGDTQIRRPAPEAPEFMRDEARKVWDELAGELVAKDRLQPLFVYSFATYCESVASFIDATACLAMEGYYFETKTRNGLQQKKRAMWGVQQEAITAMTRLSALFGLSPVDESRLKGGGQGDLFEDVMRQLRDGTG